MWVRRSYYRRGPGALARAAQGLRVSGRYRQLRSRAPGSIAGRWATERTRPRPTASSTSYTKAGAEDGGGNMKQWMKGFYGKNCNFNNRLHAPAPRVGRRLVSRVPAEGAARRRRLGGARGHVRLGGI